MSSHRNHLLAAEHYLIIIFDLNRNWIKVFEREFFVVFWLYLPALTLLQMVLSTLKVTKIVWLFWGYTHEHINSTTVKLKFPFKSNNTTFRAGITEDRLAASVLSC